MRIKINLLIIVFLLGFFITPLRASNDKILYLIEQGVFDKALILTEVQLTNKQDDVYYLFLKGVILTKMDRLKVAESIFISLTKKHPELPEPYNNLAVVYAAKGDFHRAETTLHQAIKTGPSYSSILNNLTSLYEKTASQTYSKVLKLDLKQKNKEFLSVINALQKKYRQYMVRLKQTELDDLQDQLNAQASRLAEDEITINTIQQKLDIKEQTLIQNERVIFQLQEELEHRQRLIAKEAQHNLSFQQELRELQNRLTAREEETFRIERDISDSTTQKEADLQSFHDAHIEQAKRLSEVELGLVSAIKQKVNNPALNRIPVSALESVASHEKEQAPETILLDQPGLKKQPLREINTTKASKAAFVVIKAVEIEPPASIQEIGISSLKVRKVLDKEIYTKMASQSYSYEPETNKLSKNESRDRDRDRDRDIKTAINNWVKAWTDKNLTNYFKSYSATFSPQKQLTYSQWKKQRRALLNKPEFIKIHLDRVKIALLGKNRALVSFIQTYQSNYYNDEVNKKLLLNNTGEGWLISKEYSN